MLPLTKLVTSADRGFRREKDVADCDLSEWPPTLTFVIFYNKNKVSP